MENKNIRVRFAPSPTGGLHLGGVRTVLFNYLFAKQHQGSFIVRIEDTDQTRFVAGAEQYIFDCLQWCGLTPDESTVNGGPFAPYRQSERKAIYKQYALELIEKGYAYYAFDTPEQLEEKRKGVPNFQYNHQTRRQCTNSLTLSPEVVLQKLANNTPYVIRIKMPENETVTCHDMIRGTVEFNTGLSDDKALLKADGMPTYHLAVVVDDFLMQITHAFRGEEWLPSAPIHILLWKYLFGLDKMPKWAHLPLILKPDGNGKLSKRDGERLGFPVFAMDWTDPVTGNTTTGFKERGFLPEAFVNMLAMLGWNDGSGQEIFSLQELIEKFSIKRIHKGGAKFDYEKAKWFNHSWLQQLPVQHYVANVKPYFAKAGITITNDAYLHKVMELVKERCQLLPDFVEQSSFFFQHPEHIDTASIAGKWNAAQQQFFVELIRNLELATTWDTENLEKDFKEMAAAHQLKPGELMLPFRIMLVGGKFGPHVFDIAAAIGKAATIHRIKHTLQLLQ